MKKITELHRPPCSSLILKIYAPPVTTSLAFPHNAPIWEILVVSDELQAAIEFFGRLITVRGLMVLTHGSVSFPDENPTIPALPDLVRSET